MLNPGGRASPPKPATEPGDTDDNEEDIFEDTHSSIGSEAADMGDDTERIAREQARGKSQERYPEHMRGKLDVPEEEDG